MKTYSVSIRLFLEMRQCPEAEIANTLRGTVTEDMRKYACTHSALIDWAVSGEDIAASIASIPPDEYRPDDGAFPAWTARVVP